MVFTNDGFGHDFEKEITPIKVLVMNKSIDLQLQWPMQNMHSSFNCKQESQNEQVFLASGTIMLGLGLA